MIYKDKNTIKTMQSLSDRDCSYGYNRRRSDRETKRKLSNFRIKVSDKIWWDSLDLNIQKSICIGYGNWYNKKISFLEYISDSRKSYPGDLVLIRNKKINQLLK